MAKSMTGYGKGTAVSGATLLTVELKSINSRFCEIHVRQPRTLNALEPQFRSRLQVRIQRGKIDASITLVDGNQCTKTISVNMAMATAYNDALMAIGQTVGSVYQPNSRHLASFPDVLQVTDADLDMELLKDLLFRAQDEAISALEKARAAEGQKLTTDVLAGLDRLGELKQMVAERAKVVPALYRQRLETRLNELLSPEQQAFFDQGRLAAEVLVFADKADIHEELIRLESHLMQMRLIAVKNDAVGKKMDFFCQEMNREINTIGSKANDEQITHQIIDMKAVLEMVREQVQNIE